MTVAFLYDDPGYLGGAELTMREFAAAAPEPLVSVEEADTVVVGNCVTFGPDLIDELAGKKIIRYHNDLARNEHPDLREWLERNATHVFTSPLHRKLYGLDGECIPPPLDLGSFRPPAQDGKGAVAIAPWMNPGKGQHLLQEWSDQNEPVDVFGGGPYQPNGANLDLKGPLEPQEVAGTLWGYRRFVHLPTSPEPFGRAVVEAWAAGLELVVNRLVGALHYIREEPEKLDTAAKDLWTLVSA